MISSTLVSEPELAVKQDSGSARYWVYRVVYVEDGCTHGYIYAGHSFLALLRATLSHVNLSRTGFLCSFSSGKSAKMGGVQPPSSLRD